MLYSINTKNPKNKVAKKYTKNLIKKVAKKVHTYQFYNLIAKYKY